MAEPKKNRSEASTSGGGGGRGESVVGDVGRRKSTCGYCKSGALTSISHGLWAHSLTVDDYQALLDRGWRRSGCFLYKPNMEKTCCPSYTIRLRAGAFVPSKEQVRVSKKMQRFLNNTLDVIKADKSTEELNTSAGSCSSEHNCDKNSAAMDSIDGNDRDETGQSMHLLSDQIDKTVDLCVKRGELPANLQLPKASIKRVAPSKRKLQAEKSEELMFSCNVAFQIVATIRRAKKDVEHVESLKLGFGESNDFCKLYPQKTAEILASHLKQLAESHGFSVRACNGHINFYFAMNQADQVEVGRGKVCQASSPTTGANDRIVKKNTRGHGSQERKIEIQLKRSSFDYEEYDLYRKYQLRVHNDTPEHVTESSYKRFLVDTPLVYVPPNDDDAMPPCGFGSFHQQYVVDGKLIAVGIIDILPKCLSSKYLFWDPDLAFLSLGKYSALEEIRWIWENQVHCPTLQFYYLGYYIHSCSKMRYKAAYQPSELLCPLRYQWVPYDIAKPLLDRRKYVVLSDYATLQNEDSSPLNVTDCYMEEQQNEFDQETSNDVSMHDDEMAELDSDSSDVESDSEAGDTVTTALDDAEIGNILIGIRGHRLRYKDIRHAFDPSRRRFMETQLERYVKAVGTDLSKLLVYAVG